MLFLRRSPVEEHTEKRSPINLTYLDLEKTCNIVPRDLIATTLRDHLLPEEFIGMPVTWLTSQTKKRLSIKKLESKRYA